MKNNFNRLQNAISFFVFSWSIALIVCTGVTVASPKNLPAPREEQLLNNMKILVWSDPTNQNVMLKLRIHGGAAFDVKGKEGTAQLLADMFFPDSQTKQFFEEELGGSLNVECNYDFIEVTVSGRAAEFNSILETLRNGVVNVPIAPETFQKIRAARLKLAQTENVKSINVADATVRKKLFGEFPYGRLIGGTPETLAKIDHVDLLLARDRLLTADNSTLAIVGNIKASAALRAIKQLFGVWQKADKPLRSTFRQPDPPDNKLMVVQLPGVDQSQIRFALRGAARNSADFFAAEIAAEVLQARWRESLPIEVRQAAFVRHEPHALPGIVIFGVSIEGMNVASYLTSAAAAFNKILSAPLTKDEFERAQKNVTTVIAANLNQSDAAARFWLDADTFKFDTKIKPDEAIASVNLLQVQDLIANWKKQTPVTIGVTEGAVNSVK